MVTPYSLTSANIVATPTVGSSAGSFTPNTANNGTQAQTHFSAAFDPSSTPLPGQAFTLEFFGRRDGPASLGGSSGWEMSFSALFKPADLSDEITAYFGLLNTSAAPASGTARLFADVGGALDEGTPGGIIYNYDIANAAFTHFALVVDVLVMRVYIAGVKVIDQALTGPWPADMRFVSMQVVSYTYAGETALRYYDSVRLSAGALYSANFTPPSGPLA